MDLQQYRELLTVKKTQVQMMIDRCFPVSPLEQSILDMNIDQFVNYISGIFNGTIECPFLSVLAAFPLPDNYKNNPRSVLGNVYTKMVNGRKISCLVYYVYQPSGVMISKSIANALVATVEGINTQIKYQQLIIIGKIKQSPDCGKLLRDLKNTDVWFFLDRMLFFNPTLHALTPPHRLLSKKEAGRTRKEFTAIQQISENDAIVRYYGWRVGDIIEIERNLSEMDCLVDKAINKRVVVRSTFFC